MEDKKNMQKKKNYTAMFTGLIAVMVMVVSVFALSGGFTKVIDNSEDVKLAVDGAIQAYSLEKATEIQGLQEQIVTLTTAEEVLEEEAIIEKLISEGYDLDEILLMVDIDKAFSDRELNLFDGKIDFDEDEYDAEEYLVLDGLVLSINEKDFKDNVYLSIPEDSVSFELEFESDLDTSLINDEDTLVFNFLGSEVEVSEWNGNELKFSEGSEFYLSEGEVAEGVILDMVLEDAVYVKVDGIGKKIFEGKTMTVGGIEIYAKEVLYTAKSSSVSKATLVIGEDVEKTVKDGDEVAEDSIWEYVISANSIGIKLAEEFVELDDEFAVLSVDEEFCLPNSYVCFKYTGLIESDVEDYKFDIESEGGLDYVEVEGNFVSGFDDYGLVYVNSTGIYDEDFELIGTSVELGDTDLTLDSGASYISIGSDIELSNDLTDVKVDGASIAGNEDNYLTEYGILIESPEDSVDDQRFNLSIPEEKAEGNLVFY